MLYPAYRSLEFPLNSLWQAGHEAGISELRDALQRIAGNSRKVSAKMPNIGCREALAHWDDVTAIVQNLVRLRTEQTADPI